MKYKTAFRLALKAIGLLVIAQAVPGLIVSCGSVALNFLTNGMFGYDPTGISSWELRSGIAHVLSALVGLYLLFGGRWIVNLAIPSNRPYCHECGYELTGNITGLCPECGTPNLPPERTTSISSPQQP
jgi:hypothetical protein